MDSDGASMVRLWCFDGAFVVVYMRFDVPSHGRSWPPIHCASMGFHGLPWYLDGGLCALMGLIWCFHGAFMNSHGVCMELYTLSWIPLRLDRGVCA